MKSYPTKSKKKSRPPRKPATRPLVATPQAVAVRTWLDNAHETIRDFIIETVRLTPNPANDLQAGPESDLIDTAVFLLSEVNAKLGELLHADSPAGVVDMPSPSEVRRRVALWVAEQESHLDRVAAIAARIGGQAARKGGVLAGATLPESWVTFSRSLSEARSDLSACVIDIANVSDPLAGLGREGGAP